MELSFSNIASKLSLIGNNLHQVEKKKVAFNQQINNNVEALFNGFSSHPVVDNKMRYQHIEVPMAKNQFQFLVNIGSQGQNKLQPSHLSNYLNICEHKRKKSTHSPIEIDKTHIQGFLQIVSLELKASFDLKELIKKINIEQWFNEVDFFNNGYIDCNGLKQFIDHYAEGPKQILDKQCLLILSKVKKGSTDKLFQEDLKEFVFYGCQSDESQDKGRINSSEEDIAFVLSSENLDSPVFNSININSLMFPTLNYCQQSHQGSSEENIDPLTHNKSQIRQNYFEPVNKIEKSQMYKSQQGLQPFNFQQNPTNIELKKLKQELNLTFEQKLLKIHLRNKKYLSFCKSQMQHFPPSTLYLPSTTEFIPKKAEIVFKLQLVGDHYNTICKEIENLINGDRKFNFLNGFSIIDIDENNSISFDNFMDFLCDCNLRIPTNIVSIFFDLFSSNNIMKYCNYLKMFKLKSVMKDYELCSKRIPHITGNWSENMKNCYIRFMKSIISLYSELFSYISQLEGEQEKVRDILNGIQYSQGLQQLMGVKYKGFIEQICVDGDFKPHNIFNFLK